MSHLPVEPEFEQAYRELSMSLDQSTLFEKYPEYRRALAAAIIPERTIQFRVTWENDRGELEVNRGYRVQFNSALGPFKGGLRFHPTVNMSILKFLGFEQIFKNALTGLNMGGGKGGADFDPKGKSDGEIRKFCSAFMMELSKHIGADIDVPAGDIGVGGREVGYLFGAYKRQRHIWEGVLTGKGISWGGSYMRPEATGYGLVYYVQHMIEYATNGKEGFKGKRVAVSGSGNVAQFAALRVVEFGGTVVSLSDSRGSLVVRNPETDSLTPADIKLVMQLKNERKQLAAILDDADADAAHAAPDLRRRCEFIEGARPWMHVGNVEVVLPCATQNEISGPEAETLIERGAKYVAEGSNMGCTLAAVEHFEDQREKQPRGQSVWYGPGKAANAGGVAVSGLEMAQNSQRLTWTAEEVDQKLKDIMKECFQKGVRTAESYTRTQREDALPSLVVGSNVAGFVKVVQAMHEQGDWF